MDSQDKLNRPTEGVEFGAALIMLQSGQKVFRKGWHLGGMYLMLQIADANSANTLPYIYIVIPGKKAFEGATSSDDLPAQRVPWVASQTDMLTDDWFAVNGEA